MAVSRFEAMNPFATGSATLRVASIVATIACTPDGNTDNITDNNHMAEDAPCLSALWKIVDACVAAEQRAQQVNHRRNASDIPAALTVLRLDMNTFGQHVTAPILGTLSTTEYHAALVRSLQVLNIANNNDDDSSDLGAFATMSTQLRELAFLNCGLTSLQSLEGRCQYLQKVVLDGCGHLGCLAGLEHHAWLREVRVVGVPTITSLEPLRSCIALTRVDLRWCQGLSSLQGLEHHQWLEDVIVSCTPIPSVEPLLSCPALKKVELCWCQALSSLEGLEGHQRLEEVDASHTAVATVEPLLSCPALTKVNLRNCFELSSLQGLEGHQRLEEVIASATAIPSVEVLLTCPRLAAVDLRWCQALSSLEGLQDHEWLQEVLVACTSITSVDPLRTCPALTKVDISGCHELPSNASALLPSPT